MNIWDILILLVVAGMVFLALRAIRGRKGGCSCGSSECCSCAGGCEKCAAQAACKAEKEEQKHG